MTIKEALYKGELLESVQMNGNSVMLTLKEGYDSESNYKLINRLFYNKYYNSSEFKAKFKRPSNGNGKPQLTLKDKHGYSSDDDLLEALKRFAAPNNQVRDRETPHQNNRVSDDASLDNLMENAVDQEFSGNSINEIQADFELFSLEMDENFNYLLNYL